VASLHSADGEGYVTIAIAEGGGALEEVTPQEEPNGGEWEWPWGFYGFRVTGVIGPVLVEMFLHEGSIDGSPTHYVKQGPLGPDQEPSFYHFEYDESEGTGATFDGNKVLLHFVDGHLGDHDWEENEVIVDPGGPVILAEGASDGASGCSCRIADRASVVSNLGLGLLVLGLLVSRRRRRRR
jgi:MYXO-CTERM domain-containing protein